MRTITSKPKWGLFKGFVQAEWLDMDGDKPGSRDMRLLSDFQYTDPDGRIWEASIGEIVNGASIPRFFWRVFGTPYVGPWRKPSVLHDVACQYQMKRGDKWPDIHLMFYNACRCAGMRWLKSWMAWIAVRYGGPGSFVYRVSCLWHRGFCYRSK